MSQVRDLTCPGWEKTVFGAKAEDPRERENPKVFAA